MTAKLYPEWRKAEVWADLNYKTLEDGLKELEAEIAKIPEDCRAEARFGLADGDIKIEFIRPETDAERNKRLHWAQQDEIRERAKLAELKAKYEGKP
jgi:hypothetical protein